MKKKLLLVLSIVALLVCLFAISVSAENALKPQDNNNYGELSFFDESITVGRTDSQNGFSPYIDEAGSTYARVVIGDGSTFYTFPTAYVYSSTSIYGSDGKTLWSYDLTSLNSAMATATGTNPSWTVSNVYRIELPYNTQFLNGDGTQKFYGFSNVIEIYLQPNSTTIDTGSNINCLFHSCEKLTTIHNIDTFLFKSNNNIAGTFQNCKSLTSLTLGVSPAITKINNSMFNSCTNLESVNVVEAFPNCKEVGNSAFINCNALKTISSARNDGVIELSYTYYDNSAFQNCDSIKAIKFTASSMKILQSVFHSLDNLEYISFPKDAKLELPSCEVFSNNEKLKAVAFPDDCTVIPDRGFKNCKGLYAVYLPANLYELKTNGGGQGAFAYADDLYFVQEWFDVLDENGEFLFEKFEMPERPDVYYFPSTLTLFYEKDGGTGFDGNYNLNPVMVLPETVTKLWVYDGCFYNCGTTDNQKTIVMLGDMETVRFNMRDSRTVGINYVFANKLDQDLSSVNVVDTTDRTCYNVTNETMYFCSTGKTYALSQWEAHPDPAEFEFTVENKHVHNPNADKSTGATYLENAKAEQHCFCGHVMETVEEENTALFTVKGYSTDGNSLVFVITVNTTAIADYNTANEKNIKYGIVASQIYNDGDLLNADGTVQADTVLSADFTGTEYSLLQIKITGVSGDASETPLHCCAFVADGTSVAYLYEKESKATQGTLANQVTYSQIANK